MRLPLHQSGRLTEARAGYKSVLRKTPGNYHAWHFLGLLERQLGKPQDAATCIKRALAISCVLHLCCTIVVKVIRTSKSTATQARRCICETTRP